MTTINLKLGYFIEMESMCYTFKQKYKGKDRKGNEKGAERSIGYFGSMHHAIERYLKVGERIPNFRTMEEETGQIKFA